MSCGTLVWVGVVILRKDGRSFINEVIGLCAMSGFCVGVNGRRETWSFVLVGGDWNGFSFEGVTP